MYFNITQMQYTFTFLKLVMLLGNARAKITIHQSLWLSILDKF